MVRAKDFDERSFAEQLLLRALILSLLLHLLAFGAWKWGRAQGWWREVHFPAWMRLSPKLLKPIAVSPKFPLAPKPPQHPPPQLTFVDVDPALAQPAPPKTPKFYSSANTFAGNPHPKDSVVPEIQGRQNKVVKTTPDVRFKPQPLQPSPPKKEVVKTTPKEIPKKTLAPGDLAMARPSPKPQEKEGKADKETPDQVQQQPVHERPRTIAEAMAQRGMLGEKSRQDGGVRHMTMDSSLDAMKTSFGDYDREFIDAVRARWYQLLDNTTVTGNGRVVVEFWLHPDGRITNLRILQNEMSDMLGLICQRAIYDPAPYRPWPEEMRRDIPKDYRDVTFTFYYSTE